MDKKSNSNKERPVLSYALSFGRYDELFELLKLGEMKVLKDAKSDQNSFMPIKARDTDVYVAEPDGKLIPDMPGQKKCDYLIYCQNRLQTCFVELKGENISVKKSYNPYDQISDTIKFLQNEDELKRLVGANIEKHAFIVSPGRQKIPKGVETKERQLWQKLAQSGKKTKITDLVHYVKVTKSDRYSNNGQIICSPRSPIEIPFHN